MTKQIDELYQGIIQGDRRSLAKAITLVESNLKQDRSEAESLLLKIMPHTGKALRIGISGMPGVGKSSLIEKLGLHIITQKKSLAVLAIDPSSPVSGGSILGDKTRMELLSREQNVFIRPSPSGRSVGGVARHTRESILLCEAAGFDLIFVETVGVGQAEYTVASMVDTFVVMQLPGSGDELQGIKKGILELADILVVNKADGPLWALANQAKTEHERAFHLVRKEAWHPPVLTTSALENRGIEELFGTLLKHHNYLSSSKELHTKRATQADEWFKQDLSENIKDWLLSAQNAEKLSALEKAVKAAQIPASVAAKQILEKLILNV